MRDSDFWWLTPTQKATCTHVTFGHHRPIREDEDPRSVGWVTQAGRVSQVDRWRSKYWDKNVYRSLAVTSGTSESTGVVGPFVVDIDTDEDLEDALLVARKTVRILEYQLGVELRYLRVFFTGHKGFNLEVHPLAIGLEGTVGSQIRKSADYLHRVVAALRLGRLWKLDNQVGDAGTVVDQIYGGRRSGYALKHPYLRLHDSVNCWIMPDGTTGSRRKTELTIEELCRLTVAEIVSRSEGQPD